MLPIGDLSVKGGVAVITATPLRRIILIRTLLL